MASNTSCRNENIPNLPTVDTIVEQLSQIEALAADTFKETDNIKQDILEYGSDPIDELMTLKESMKKLANMRREIRAMSSSALRVKSLLENKASEDEQAILNKFDKILKECLKEEEIEENQKAAIASLEKQLIRQQDQSEGDNDELQVTEAIESFKDPITKKVIVDIVKSKTCNHFYERSSILKHLRRSKKCPYPGCQVILQAQDLVDDPELINKLLQFRETICD